MKRPQAETAAEFEALLSFLLARAFASQLVPKNASNEPASGLLERLKQQEPAAPVC